MKSSVLHYHPRAVQTLFTFPALTDYYWSSTGVAYFVLWKDRPTCVTLGSWRRDAPLHELPLIPNGFGGIYCVQKGKSVPSSECCSVCNCLMPKEQ